MNRKRTWKGSMAVQIQKHLSLRQAVGRESRADESVLYHYHLFVNRHYPRLKTPNRKSILAYMSSRKRLSPWGRRNTVIAIRQFCRFLVSRGVETYVPDRTLVPKLQYKLRYFPLKEKQIIQFMREIDNAPYYKPVIGKTYATMLGLLWCTGMRRKEIIQLNHSDVNLRKGTILIRMTKFRKSRMIPIKPSVVQALEQYCKFKRRHGIHGKLNDPFFVTREGERVPSHSLGTMFSRLVRRSGLRNTEGRYPCIHDFRHNFATNTIKLFYLNPNKFPPQSYLPTLATFLGHSDIKYSQFYIHPDFDLLMTASDRIEDQQRKGAYLWQKPAN